MYRWVLVVAVILLGVCTLFYVYCHLSLSNEIESKLRQIADKIMQDNSLIQAIPFEMYGDVSVEIIDTKVTDTIFQRQNKTQYIMLEPFRGGTLKITSDISLEIAFLKNLLWGMIGVSGIILFVFIIFLFFYVYSFKKNLQKTIATFNGLQTLMPQELEINGRMELKTFFAALKHWLQKLHSYYEAQQQFYSGIAHELKTPLAVIKTKCEVTLLKPRENAVYINVLEENIQSVNSAQASIKVLFDLANGKANQIQCVNIQKELENLIKDFALLGRDRKFNYQLQTQDLEILINPALLRQIVRNFLQNAFKFTQKDKVVCLKSYVENGILKIEVLDEGSGIVTNFDVFAPFNKSGGQEGMGLGLFLAKNAAKALGGDINVQNRKDTQGVIATFTLNINL